MDSPELTDDIGKWDRLFKEIEKRGRKILIKPEGHTKSKNILKTKKVQPRTPLN